MPYFYAKNELNTHPLTKDEKAWCRKLEKILMSAPDRFELTTIGDSALSVVDKEAMDSIGVEIEESSASDNKMTLAEITSKPAISGLCG
jgi:hypothetical protein